MKTGIEARDEALERVILPPDNQYWACLAHAYRWVLAQPVGSEFMSWHVAEHYTGDPAEPRVWGPVMMQLKRNGLIASTKRYDRYPGASRNAAPALIWVRLGR